MTQILIKNLRYYSTESNKTWVAATLSDLPLKDVDKNNLIRFWDEFYKLYLIKTDPNLSNTDQSCSNLKLSHSGMYKEEVFSLLESKKGEFPLTEDELRDLQITIEDLTMNFDEESVSVSPSPNVLY